MKCPDCPDLAGDRMPPGWTPRARCCVDDHIERRLSGSTEPYVNHETARALADQAQAHETRQQRRYRERTGRRS